MLRKTILFLSSGVLVLAMISLANHLMKGDGTGIVRPWLILWETAVITLTTVTILLMLTAPAKGTME